MGWIPCPAPTSCLPLCFSKRTVRVRKSYDYLDSRSLNCLCTSYFLFACYYGLEMHDKAWFHLREATTLIHMSGMNKEATYLQYDGIESSRRRRLYWLLFVSERYVELCYAQPSSADVLLIISFQGICNATRSSFVPPGHH